MEVDAMRVNRTRLSHQVSKLRNGEFVLRDRDPISAGGHVSTSLFDSGLGGWVKKAITGR